MICSLDWGGRPEGTSSEWRLRGERLFFFERERERKVTQRGECFVCFGLFLSPSLTRHLPFPLLSPLISLPSLPPSSLDASILVVDSSNNLVKTVNFMNKSYGKAITHRGDNQTGEGEGDDERIDIE